IRGHSSWVLPRRKRGGFALLITITLLAFLVLLLVSLASLTRVETQVASNNQSISQARQNALMALNIALGQLQKYTGPDQRVTGPADIQIPSAVVITPPTRNSAGIITSPGTSGATALASINSYWSGASGTRNRRWIGAWRNINTTAYDPDAQTAYNPKPGLQSWLVSGNENTPDASDPLAANADDRFVYKPSDIVTGLTITSTPLTEIPDANGQPHRLLVSASAGVTNTASLDRAVTAPQMTIQSNTVPGLGNTPVPIGHYAWWVGDEGVKSRANLVDPYAGDPSADAARIRRQSAQRPAIEAMTTNGSDGLASTYPVNLSDLTKVFTPAQLGFLNSSTTFPSALKERFHDLSTSSRGVLSDVKNGGLKRDLTHILSRPTQSEFRTALNTVGHGFPAYDAALLSGTSSPALSTATTPYAAFPLNNVQYAYGPTPGTAATPNMFTYGATWEQLWSFYNMGNLTTASPAGVVDPLTGYSVARKPTGTQQGLYPVLMQAKLFYRLRIGDGVANNDADGTNRTDTVQVDVLPMAVIANPYNVTLSGDYILRLRGYSPTIRFGTPADPSNPTIAEFPVTTHATNQNLDSAYTGDVLLVLKAPALLPGQAQVFTIDPTHSLSDVTVTNNTDARRIRMVNDYDPTTFFTYNSGTRIPATSTHATLYAPTSLLSGDLYMDVPLTDLENRIQYVSSHRPSSLAATEGASFLVYPMRSGRRQGGGALFYIYDASLGNQHAHFYQSSYRPLMINSTGSSADNRHPLQWSRTHVYHGNTAIDDTQPNPFFLANILQPDGADSDPALQGLARWGLVNAGIGAYLTDLRPGVAADASFTNLLYDIPQPGRTITSIGQLQHFNTTGYVGGSSVPALMTHQFQTNYPIGNSYPNARIGREVTINSVFPHNYVYDSSYLWNDIFWDRFHFSSYPATGNFDFTDPTDKLVNSRYKPFRDASEVPPDDETRFRGLYKAAENLLVDGAFNINSTSIEAWKAVFSSLKGVPVGTEANVANRSAPFTRTLSPAGGATDAKTGLVANAWSGFRNLTQAEVNMLAEEMVLQVRLRGPFLSMSEFVNRRLILKADDSYGLGLSGALQAAIDKVTNKETDVPSAPFNERTTLNTPHGRVLPDADYTMIKIAGFPGYLLQGDVLSSLGPNLTARSDTFTIRTYGDTVNPATGVVQAQAWCEAVVQRTPDYVVAQSGATGNAADEAATDPANIEFGRRYKIVSFRWLSSGDI
ncbi:MAG TPA: hypothetical protein VIO38_11000, partial [Rariglobus sp.]